MRSIIGVMIFTKISLIGNNSLTYLVRYTYLAKNSIPHTYSWGSTSLAQVFVSFSLSNISDFSVSSRRALIAAVLSLK